MFVIRVIENTFGLLAQNSNIVLLKSQKSAVLSFKHFASVSR